MTDFNVAEGYMNRLLGMLALLLAFGLPAVAQVQRMTPEDEDQFNNYYSRWQQDRQTDHRDDMVSMEHHMQDLMNKYAIPSDTPYDQVAAQNGPGPRYDDRDRDDRRPAGNWQGQLSADDQHKFNKEYEKWQESNAKNDRDDINKHARNMEEIMQRYSIPPNTPFDTIATANGYAPRVDYRRYQGRFSPDDQKKFDKAYEKWQKDRAKNDRDDLAKDEGKMQEVMARYSVPRDVPYDVLVSGNRGY
jgi:ubiquitin-protein ligase